MAPQLILLRFPNLPRAECKGMDPLLFDLALHGSLQSIAAELGLSHRQVLAFDNARRRRSS